MVCFWVKYLPWLKSQSRQSYFAVSLDHVNASLRCAFDEVADGTLVTWIRRPPLSPPDRRDEFTQHLKDLTYKTV